jgi:hypothetical protein
MFGQLVIHNELFHLQLAPEQLFAGNDTWLLHRLQDCLPPGDVLSTSEYVIDSERAFIYRD